MFGAGLTLGGEQGDSPFEALPDMVPEVSPPLFFGCVCVLVCVLRVLRVCFYSFVFVFGYSFVFVFGSLLPVCLCMFGSLSVCMFVHICAFLRFSLSKHHIARVFPQPAAATNLNVNPTNPARDVRRRSGTCTACGCRLCRPTRGPSTTLSASALRAAYATTSAAFASSPRFLAPMLSGLWAYLGALARPWIILRFGL